MKREHNLFNIGNGKNAMKRIILSLPLLFIMLQSLSAQYRIASSVIGSGIVTSSNSMHRIAGTVGQHVIGPVQNPQWSFSQGFWYQVRRITPVERIGEYVPAQASLDPQYPNPASSITHVNFSLPYFGAVSLTISDALGRVVRVLSEETLEAGSYHSLVDLSFIPAGMYFVRLRFKDQLLTQRLTVIK